VRACRAETASGQRRLRRLVTPSQFDQIARCSFMYMQPPSNPKRGGNQDDKVSWLQPNILFHGLTLVSLSSKFRHLATYLHMQTCRRPRRRKNKPTIGATTKCNFSCINRQRNKFKIVEAVASRSSGIVTLPSREQMSQTVARKLPKSHTARMVEPPSLKRSMCR
jgi:hypothetical protein